MKTTQWVGVLCILFAFSIQAFGQSTPQADARANNQQARIKEGVKSGELTKHEAVKLHKEQAKIHAEKKMAMADGKVTKPERAKLHHEQNKSSKHIAKQKHDNQDRK